MLGLKHGLRSPDYAAIIYFPQKCLFIVRQQVRLLLIHSGRSCHLSLLTLLQLLSSRTICQPFSILHCYHSSLSAILLTASSNTHTSHHRIRKIYFTEIEYEGIIHWCRLASHHAHHPVFLSLSFYAD